MPLLLLNKPFQVITRFSKSDARATLADFIKIPGVYPAGRLDFDSEGLLLLTDDGPLQALVTDPRHALEKVYWAEVEGIPPEGALETLRRGVALPDGLTRAAGARRLEAPEGLWPRNPPIRVRAHIPTTWIELTLREGRNRQVRRMTAAVGYPTLRLIRAQIGPFHLAGLAPGEVREISPSEAAEFKASLLATSGRQTSARSASRPRAPARS